jgi:hypothetical protein
MMQIFESTYIYFPNRFLPFDKDLLKLTIKQNIGFEVYYAYSFDNINFSENKLFHTEEEFISDKDIPVYLMFFLRRIVNTDLQPAKHFFDTDPNVDSKFSIIEIEKIEYDGISINLSHFKYKTYYQLINEFPKWNLYDNQAIPVYEWLKQCNAIAESFGHTVIYFKTEISEKDVVHTFQTNVIRNVTDIKKLHILMPNNEIPQDRIVYSDWDLPLQDDFMIHIVWDKFRQAFGINSVPMDKDYLYFPLLNKMYQVSAVQPKNSYMGKIGWWEVFLKKFEQDETVKMSKDLKHTFSDDIQQALSNISIDTDEDSPEGIEDIMNDFLNSDVANANDENPVVIEEEVFLSDTLLTQEKIDQKTIEEKKASNQAYTNKLADTTFMVSLKETEKLREFYDKRLQLISVNPDQNSYPVVMYDCTSIDKRTVGLKYNLKDFTTKNKFNTIFEDSLLLSFNYILLENFTGELFDICDPQNTVLTTIRNDRAHLSILNSFAQEEFKIHYKFEIEEFYNVCIGYNDEPNHYYVKIFKLENKQKELIYQNIYKSIIHLNNLDITRLNLFGGKFYINEIKFDINKNQILMDYCNPILQMNKFGG